MPSEGENVKVAVRVRPFNKREKDRKAKLCVKMDGNVTTVTDPEDKNPKSFTYDYSYWSFDGGKELSDGYMEPDSSHANGSKYCDQKKCYNDLGKGIIENSWKGYNSTLFAYGQTGSGKSWSVIGYGANKGIVPMLCEELFEGIKNANDDKEYEVLFSMLEIYNEVVRDLLTTKQAKSGLKIRQHPKKGFYADGLQKVMVSSHEEIAAKMEEGTVNRTIRSTNMNATSSRAHTIVTVTFVQKFKNDRGVETSKSAIINLVDLAGSERVDSTGATGERLKEGAAINLSLTCLGNCINALVKKSQGESVRIPFRDSALTKLLKNALGGNSKTVMIAAISPADINYDETVSTLNFADRAKQIKTKAVVNENPTEKLIRELKEENEKLKKLMTDGKVDKDFIDEDEDGVDDRSAAKLKQKWEEEMKARMMQNEAELLNMKKTYEEKLKQNEGGKTRSAMKKNKEDRKRKPHIYNLNSDPQLSGKVVHILKAGATTIGNRKGKESDITMIGPSMQESHATITTDKNGAVTLQPQTQDCRVLINGNPIKDQTTLQHNDRLMFGSTQIWVFQNPLKNKSKQKEPPITFEFAQEEITSKSGIDFNGLSAETDLGALQQELQDLVPAVEEANSISEDLDRKAKFEVLLLSPQMVGKTTGKPEFHVKLKNLANGTEYVWTKDKFMDRLYKMREMYNNFEDDDEDDWEDDEDNDPFQESLDTEVHIGTVQLTLQPIAHMIELKEQLEILSIKSTEVGLINVEIVPCNKKGKEYTEKDDVFVDDPDQLIGRDLHFKFKILSCRGLPNRYSEVYCSYQFYLDKEEYETKRVPDTTNPNFGYERKFTYKPVTKQFVDYLMKQSVSIKVMGKQRIRKSAIPLSEGVSTREMLKNDRTVFSKTAALMNGFQMNGRVVDPQRQSIIVELLLMKKTQARLQQRSDNVTKLVKEAENISRTQISTTLIREVMNANSPEQADAIIHKKLGNDGTGHQSSGTAKSSVCTVI